MPRRLLVMLSLVFCAPFFLAPVVDGCDCNPFGGSGGDGGNGGNGTSDGAPLSHLYGADVSEIVVEVDYQTGAAPYTGSELVFGDLWDLFLTNLDAIFSAHPKTLTVDTELSQMEELTNIEQQNFSVGDILDIADAHRQSADTASSRSFYVVFLDGYFSDHEGPNQGVLGVSIGHTRVIAMFKPVIDSTGSLRKRVEQTTLVHEIGHAVGLVGNGIEVIDETHFDVDHGHHCTNDDCVMYWQNEIGVNLTDYVAQNVLSNEVVLFDQDCINDMAGAAQ